ncbi:MAG: Protein TolB [Parcubacteria group bacterium GW2011_GWA2_43_13]|nr:MAG: Protein TolB [Parcubacteria group bacterium GW2011_GWA2_43_13]
MIDTTGNEVNLLPKKGEEGQSPKWAPNGKAIGYSGDFGVIMQMDPDGKNKRQVTQSNAWAHIDWSPDGTKIVATKATGEDIINEIWAIDIASGEEVLLTKEGDLNWYPDWSPDGTRIAFGSYRNGTFQVYTLTIATKRIRQLTNQGSNGGPVWSPDGTKIAFSSDRGGGSDIFIMTADGDNQRQVTFQKGSYFGLTWSTDGSEIVFAYTNTINHKFVDLCAVKPDGSGWRQITNTTDGSVYSDPDAFPLSALPVAPAGRTATTWGELKRVNRE